MHAEDQMMAAETIKSLVEEMIEMYNAFYVANKPRIEALKNPETWMV